MVEFLGGLLLLVGIVLLVIGGIGFLIAAFRESALWGLVVLFVGPASIAFLILHWQAAKSSFFLQLYGIGFLVAGAVFCDGHVPILS